MQHLGAIINGRWQPGIGDPTVMGWVTTAAYVVAAIACAACARRVDPASRSFRHERILLWGLAALLLVLGANKQLDLQSWFTMAGKRIAAAQGWYKQRRMVQRWFVYAVGGAGLTGFGLAGWFLRKALRRHWLALAGFAFLTGFVIIRSASIHHVDKWLKKEFAGFRMNWILEIGGIACIAASAAISLFSRVPKTPRPPSTDDG